MYNANCSVFLLRISFYIYTCLVCFMQLRKTQRSMAVWECYRSFHLIVEVKFPCIFVERNTTFPYAYNFILKYCVIHIYLTIAVGNGRYLPKILGRWVHGAAQARNRKTLKVSKEFRAVFSKNYRKYVATYSYAIFMIFVHMPYNPFSVPNRVHKLPHTDSCVITECSIMHYNKSCRFFFCLVQFSNMTN